MQNDKGILPVGFIDPAKHEKLIEKTATSYLSVLEKAARSAGVPFRLEHVTSDYPADAIIAAAKKHKCDLIFMPTHGHRGLRTTSMLGSQTQKVLAGSKIAVLVHR